MATNKLIDLSRLSRFWDKVKNYIDNALASKVDSSSLSTVATSGSYNDLTNKPTIPAAVAVKGNAETSYRTGNVNLTPANLGLGNVGNFKAVSTVANQGLNNTEKTNARNNIGAGTSSFSGNYKDLTNKPSIPSYSMSATLKTVKTGNLTSGTDNYLTFNGNQDFPIALRPMSTWSFTKAHMYYRNNGVTTTNNWSIYYVGTSQAFEIDYIHIEFKVVT